MAAVVRHRKYTRSWARCEATIKRESRYWLPRFRRVLTLDDLMQEGWLVAHKVIRAFDPERGAALETLLTLSIRRHFARLMKQTLERAFLYHREDQQAALRAHVSGSTNIERSIMYRLMWSRLESMSSDDYALAMDLIEYGHHVRKIARARQWTVPFTKERIAQLRALLKET